MSRSRKGQHEGFQYTRTEDGLVAALDRFKRYGDLMYEDELPDSMTQAEYDAWFAQSRVIDGVRMGPKMTEKIPAGRDRE